MLRSALHLFLLRHLPWSRFDFPRWRTLAILAIVSLAGMFLAAGNAMRTAASDASLSLEVSLGIMLASSALTLVIVWPTFLAFLRWWMKRGGRWDGRGDMFNLLVASTLVVNILCMGLFAIGMPVVLAVVPWLYSIWVTGNALSGAIPKASLAYSIGGLFAYMLVSLVIGLLLVLLVGIGLGLAHYVRI